MSSDRWELKAIAPKPDPGEWTVTFLRGINVHEAHFRAGTQDEAERMGVYYLGLLNDSYRDSMPPQW